MILKIMRRGFIGCSASPAAQGVHDFFVDLHSFFVDRYDFFVDLHSFFVDRYDFRWPLAAGIRSCIRHYFFGRRNPYFCRR